MGSENMECPSKPHSNLVYAEQLAFANVCFVTGIASFAIVSWLCHNGRTPKSTIISLILLYKGVLQLSVTLFIVSGCICI